MLSPMKQTEVAGVIDSLIQAGLVQQREIDQRRPTIDITAAGRRVMMATDPLPDSVQMTFPLARKLSAAARGIEPGDVQSHKTAVGFDGGDHAGDRSDAAAHWGGSSDAGETFQPPPDPRRQERIDRLKRWRRKQSSALGLPAYRLLTNATVERIAEAVPRDTEQLEAVSGVGPATVEQFGHDIVELLRSVAPSEPAEPTGDTEPAQSVSPTDPPNDAATDTDAVAGRDTSAADAYWTWRLFRDGYSATQIAHIRRCSEQALLDDLRVAAGAGHPVDSRWLRGDSGGAPTGDAPPNR
jgi:ATP-dependent DNA helicase RecQ